LLASLRPRSISAPRAAASARHYRDQRFCSTSDDFSLSSMAISHVFAGIPLRSPTIMELAELRARLTNYEILRTFQAEPDYLQAHPCSFPRYRGITGNGANWGVGGCKVPG